MSFGSQLQGHLVFIEVGFVVGAHSHEYRGLAVTQVCDVVSQRVGVNEQLQVLVLPHIVVTVLEYRTGVAWREVLGDERQRLLVLLDELCLRGVGDTAYSRRQHIVDGLLLVVFLDVHRSHFQGCTHGGCLTAVERLFVGSPVCLHQVECGKSEDDGFLEAREVHSDESYGGEVRDASLRTLILFQRNTELEPALCPLVAIAQRGGNASDVGDKVSSHQCVLGMQAHVVVEIFLVFVEGEVLIDVLHIGCGLVGGLVALGRILGIG